VKKRDERERLLKVATPEEWEGWLENRKSSDISSCLFCHAYTTPGKKTMGDTVDCIACTGVHQGCIYPDHDNTTDPLPMPERKKAARLRLEAAGILPPIFKVGDLVTLREKSEFKYQQKDCPYGIITSLKKAPSYWCDVRWVGGEIRDYRYTGPERDLEKYIPTPNDKKKPEKPAFNWKKFCDDPFFYLEAKSQGWSSCIQPSEELQRACAIPTAMFPAVNLEMLEELIIFLHKAAKGQLG
jgi:hypothetical protein